jgi:hypothetical protein
VPNPEDVLDERERLVSLRERRADTLLALVEAMQAQLEERLNHLDEQPQVLDLSALGGDRFRRDKYLADPACSYLLLVAGAFEPKSTVARDMSQALLDAVQDRNAYGPSPDDIDVEELAFVESLATTAVHHLA